MLIAVLESTPESIERDVEFSYGTFTAEGLGELSIEELRAFDAAGQLRWASNDVRALALGYSSHSSAAHDGSIAPDDTQLRLDVETEVVYVPAQRMGVRTEAELRRIVGDMTARGWVLVEDTRVGASGGHLTFHRAEPLDREQLSAVSYAG
ncbi:MAG: hypothetical protein HGB10_02295 [Coriobacteriia bacterium]|nr:hypothetical protein [Coriobacteriia bacterium]